MAVTMLLKPLDVPAPIKRAVAPLLEKSARVLMFSRAQTGPARPTPPPHLAA